MRAQATTLHRAIVCAVLLTVASACASTPVTVENSPEGKIAHYAIKVQTAKQSIVEAVKKLEAQGMLPTDQAAAVIKRAVEFDTHMVTLADLLAAYDAVNAGTQPPPNVTETTAPAILDSIQQQLTRIAAIANALLIPIQQEGARQQIADLTGALHETLLTLSMTLAKQEAK